MKFKIIRWTYEDELFVAFQIAGDPYDQARYFRSNKPAGQDELMEMFVQDLMDTEHTSRYRDRDDDFDNWLSEYGDIAVERVLEKYFETEELPDLGKRWFTATESLFNALRTIPLK